MGVSQTEIWAMNEVGDVFLSILMSKTQKKDN